MAKHSVNVIVKARDQASKKFRTIGSAASGMGNMLKKAAAAAVVYFGARAIARFTKSSLDAFMKQEDAVFQLGAALKATGEYSEATMKQFKEFASSIQQATIYGDEEVLALMRIGSTLGVSKDRLEEAAKAALSLGAAFGGRMKPEMAMRYYAQALLGVTSSLETYVVDMRGVVTYEEKMIKLQEALTRGWAIAEAQAKTTSGAIKQMKNAWGDMKEMIGEALAPTVKKFAQQIKSWAEENQKQIGDWAKRTVATMTLVKDIFRDFIKFMKEDWIAGLKFSLDTTVQLFIGLGKSLSVIFREISENMIASYTGKYERPSAKASAEETLKRQIMKERGYSIWWGTPEEKHEATLEARRRLKEFGATAYIEDVWAKDIENWEGVRTRIIDVWKETIKNIAKMTPPALAKETRESWDKYLARFAAMDSPVRTSWMDLIKEWRTSIREWWARPEKTGASAALAIAINKQLRPLESRFLTFAPGTRFNKTEQNTALTAKNTQSTAGTLKELIKLTKQVINEVRKIPGPWPFRMTNFK